MEIARKKEGGQTVVLGLETSCDETAAAVVAGRRQKTATMAASFGTKVSVISWIEVSA